MSLNSFKYSAIYIFMSKHLSFFAIYVQLIEFLSFKYSAIESLTFQKFLQPILP